MREVGKAGGNGTAGSHRDSDCNIAARAGVELEGATSRVTGGLEGKAAGMGGVILRLSMGSDVGCIVIETVRPHTMLRQHQRERQQNTQQGKEGALHDGAKYKSWCEKNASGGNQARIVARERRRDETLALNRGAGNNPICTCVQHWTGRSRLPFHPQETP